MKRPTPRTLGRLDIIGDLAFPIIIWAIVAAKGFPDTGIFFGVLVTAGTALVWRRNRRRFAQRHA